jgi:hypothetical protein
LCPKTRRIETPPLTGYIARKRLDAGRIAVIDAVIANPEAEAAGKATASSRILPWQDLVWGVLGPFSYPSLMVYSLTACCACGFFAYLCKNPDYPACFGSLQGKKSPVRRFLGVSCAKRNKLLDEGFNHE